MADVYNFTLINFHRWEQGGGRVGEASLGGFSV